MLLELVEDRRIASLTALSRDPALSPFHARAARLPVNRGNVEAIVVARPDLVITAGRATPLATRMLERLGVPLLEFEHAETFAAYARNLVRLANVLGAEQRAAALLQTLWHAIGADEPPTPSAHAPRAIVYQPNGYTPGTRTLVHRILQYAGLRDVAGELGLDGGGFVSLERLLLARPDVIVFAGRRDAEASLAEAMLHHPALRSLLDAPHAPRTVTVAAHLWTCAGSYATTALRQLGAPAR